MPDLLNLCESIEDRLPTSGILGTSLKTLDVHPRVYPGKRPANLSYYNEPTTSENGTEIHAHMMGDPSTSRMIALNGLWVAKA
jgi:hypothetical protein